MWNLRSTTLLAALLWIFAACADERPDMGEEPTSNAWTQIRMHRDMDAMGEDAWAAAAWSAEFSGVDAQAVREAMNIVDAPADGCVWMPRHRAHPGDSMLRFKAMGAAQLTDDHGAIYPLQPRSLALQTDAIHGVIYTAQLDEKGHEQWQIDLINADGSPKVHLQQAAPRGWGIVAINGDTTFENPLPLSTDRALRLHIDSDADVSMLIARSASDASQAQLVCTVADHTIELSSARLDSFDKDHDIELQVILRNHVGLEHDGIPAGDASIELHDHLRVKRVTFPHAID